MGRLRTMKAKPMLFAACAAGATAAIVKRRQAAQAVKSAVDAVTPGGREEQPHERYEPPIEGLAQEPRTPGGPPSSAARVLPPDPVASLPGDALNEPEHGPPEGSVMPDTSDDDPFVREQENAAEADAGSIGGNVGAFEADDESFDRDPADRPVAEGSGEEFETFETREDTERSNREIEP
jgi:hypothetical protein